MNPGANTAGAENAAAQVRIDAAIRPEAFFLPTAAGARFCLYYRPQPVRGETFGEILYVHPFAEEMNKTRRIAAEQARRLCRLGWGVLQIDLAGCGDSEGDFGEASWDLWHADLTAGWDWLTARSNESTSDRSGENAPERWIWGLRLGALLAATFSARLGTERSCASRADVLDPNAGVRPRADGLLLWQPVASGAQHLNQFLRLRTVQGFMNQSQGEAQATVQTLRAELIAGQSLEVAGYRLAPGLALPMAAAELAALDSLPPRVLWLDVSTQPGASPATARIVERWSALGIDVRTGVAAGPAFWQTQEIEDCPALLDMTDALIARRHEPVECAAERRAA